MMHNVLMYVQTCPADRLGVLPCRENHVRCNVHLTHEARASQGRRALPVELSSALFFFFFALCRPMHDRGDERAPVLLSCALLSAQLPSRSSRAVRHYGLKARQCFPAACR